MVEGLVIVARDMIKISESKQAALQTIPHMKFPPAR
jgi:hypothetical protein